MTNELSPEKILGLGLGFWNSKALLSAVELGLFTTLAEAPADAETLRRRLGLHERSALDFFDALVALGLLEREGGVYRNAKEADVFLDRAKPSYVGQILELANMRLFGTWNQLTQALQTGKAQSENAEGGDFFGALYADPDRLRGFLAGMSGISAGPAQAIAAKFPWTDYKTFIDVGAAQGMVPVTVARAHPHLSGGGFDLPQVKPVFEDYVAEHGLSDRLTFHAGDFFKDDLPTIDVIVMGHILHDWNLDEKRRLLAKAHAALPKGGALIVYESLIDDERKENAFGLLMSLNMLIETPGGFDYTGADCQSWMREAGFSKTRVEHLVGPDSMVVGVK
jgi:precorrin-6B methylase 2